MVKFEFNKEKLAVIGSSLEMIAQNLNIETHNKRASLKLLETLNLTSGDTGLMDLQMEQVRSDIKFLESQASSLQSLIVMSKQ